MIRGASSMVTIAVTMLPLTFLDSKTFALDETRQRTSSTRRSSPFSLLFPLRLARPLIQGKRKKAQITIGWFVGSAEGRETRESDHAGGKSRRCDRP